jgi:hypothetical protein
MSSSLPKEYNVIIHMRSSRRVEIGYACKKLDAVNPSRAVNSPLEVADTIMNGAYVVIPGPSGGAVVIIPAEVEYIEIIETPYNPSY